MNYIKNIGEKSLKAFESLKNVEHSKIKIGAAVTVVSYQNESFSSK